MPKYENPGKKIHFYDKIIPGKAEIQLPPATKPLPLMRLDPPRQIHFGHLVVVIL
jgi:hypothetical protein